MCSFITTLWLASSGRRGGRVANWHGCPPQLLSRLRVSSEVWPSLLMSLLATLPRSRVSSQVPQPCCRVSEPRSGPLHWPDGPHPVCPPRSPGTPFCSPLCPSPISREWSRIAVSPARAQGWTSFIRPSRFRQGERKTTASPFGFHDVGQIGGAGGPGAQGMACSGNDGSGLLFKSLLRN